MSVIETKTIDKVQLLTINRPKAMNALNADVLDGLAAALEALPEGTRSVVITGAGRAFVAGADIAAMKNLTPEEAEAFAAKGQRLGETIAQAPYVVIAAVNGYALGGGCELAMSCDIIMAGPYAKFGQPEVNLGVIPGFGGTQRLVRRVGLSMALDLCLTGRIVNAQQALCMGLVSQVVEDDVVESALEVAQTISEKGPIAVHLAKKVIHENADADLPSALAAERAMFGQCFSTSDQKEGMNAFLEKRKAEFQGR